MSGRVRAAAVVTSVAVLVSACTGSASDPKESTMDTSSPPASTVTTPQQAGPMLCDFVPKDAVVSVLTSPDVTSTGSTSGFGTGISGACTVSRAGDELPSVEVFLNAADDASTGSDATQVRADTAAHRDDWFVFPASVGVGYSHAEYTATVKGSKVTGALSFLDTGPTVVGVRLYRPEPGRDAVADAAAIARAVAAAL